MMLTRKLLLLFSLALLTLACASTPDVGVRHDYRSARVRSVAVVPFYAVGTFGLGDDEFELLRLTYQAQAIAWLQKMGFEVMEPEALQHHLSHHELREIFEEGVLLRSALTSYFEPSNDGQTPGVEVLTLRTLARQEALPTDTLLIGQIVYHSRGTCRQAPDAFTPYARTSATADTPAGYPRPCVVSHFQAKLVDIHTGHTMWFNRMHRESYGRQINEDLTLHNITRTIQDTLGEGSGLEELIAAPPTLQVNASTDVPEAQ
ncbi:hypothetical protein DL240_04165 [Lujinxingia litoralis]|uniref:DUF4136 domain-containing protein n=1 Tax=Lujinxingia litoralis TaxID=2211119 RepID=A0A328CBZ3_9DELT|nr:hypothetical protein [Lujinxingia litoralis]RAL25414.1 hypothetical protein DL240_04165 [Lujinxingia litoralis]